MSHPNVTGERSEAREEESMDIVSGEGILQCNWIQWVSVNLVQLESQ